MHSLRWAMADNIQVPFEQLYFFKKDSKFNISQGLAFKKIVSVQFRKHSNIPTEYKIISNRERKQEDADYTNLADQVKYEHPDYDELQLIIKRAAYQRFVFKKLNIGDKAKSLYLDVSCKC